MSHSLLSRPPQPTPKVRGGAKTRWTAEQARAFGRKGGQARQAKAREATRQRRERSTP